MALVVTPSEMQIRTALRGFLVQVLPAGVDVVLGQQNRVPEPQAGAFGVIWPLRYKRLATNLHSWQDSKFPGSISGTTMTVGTVTGLPLAAGRQVFGPGVAPNTIIKSGSGTSWQVTPSQTVAPGGTFSAGAATFTIQGEVVYQVDLHGTPPNAPQPSPDASDMKTAVVTMFRDYYATSYFAGIGFPVRPVSVDEGREVPWSNAEEQYEMMWVLEAKMQANQVVSGVPAEFADSAVFSSVNVDVAFPP